MVELRCHEWYGVLSVGAWILLAEIFEESGIVPEVEKE